MNRAKPVQLAPCPPARVGTELLGQPRDRLAKGDSAVDVCEAVVRVLEDDPHFNAGVGAVFNEQGEVDGVGMGPKGGTPEPDAGS